MSHMCGSNTCTGTYKSHEIDHLEPVESFRLRAHVASLQKLESSQSRIKHGMIQPFPDSVHVSFTAFGEQHTYTLEVMDQLFAPDSKATIVGANGVKREHPMKLVAYQRDLDNGWVTATLRGDGTMHALVLRDGKMLQIDPVSHHEHHLPLQSYKDLQAASPHRMAAFQVQDAKLDSMLCGSLDSKWKKNQNGEDATARRSPIQPSSLVPPRAAHANLHENHGDAGADPVNSHNNDAKEGLEVYPLSSDHARRLLAVDRWTNCYASDHITRKMKMGFAVDASYYELWNGDVDTITTNIANIIAASNQIYEKQLNIYLQAESFHFETAYGGDTEWNPSASDGCESSMEVLIPKFALWRSTSAQSGSLTHLLTNCFPPPGVVGLAYIGVLCELRYGVGISTHSSSTWITVAHEIGHNFGAQHSFEEGTGVTGGIMDYGSAEQLKIDGEFQFNTEYRKPEVCAEISSQIQSSVRGAECFEVFESICGDGFKDDSEECDAPDSECCSDTCTLALPEYECVSGECCEGCKFKSTDSLCSTGYCNAGQCESAFCSIYGLDFCGVSDSNSCEVMCVYQSQCMSLAIYNNGNTGEPIDTDAADGARCDGTGVCFDGQCVKSYAYREYSFGDCDVSCGGGTQTRSESYCYDLSGDINTPVSDSLCSGAKPASTQECNAQSCSYTTGTWGACSEECGGGNQYRPVHCIQFQQGTAVEVVDSKCSGEVMPADSQVCGTAACPAYEWTEEDWSACSFTCGGGEKTRSVAKCVNEAANNAIVDDAFCSESARPDSTQVCNVQSCVYSVAEWSACSEECGGGVLTRGVLCQRTDAAGVTSTVADTYCASTTKPDTSQACNTHECPNYVFFEYDWEECDTSCGGGTKKRSESYCYDANSPSAGSVADAKCAGQTKPASSVSCNENSCSYTADSWGACSEDCGGGTRERQVFCVQTVAGIAVAVADTHCFDASKPIASEACNTQQCLTYTYDESPWLACDVSCGGGTQRREEDVYCYESTKPGVAVAESMCGALSKPATTQPCQSQSCAFTVGSWSECTEDCGGGVQTRDVHCTQVQEGDKFTEVDDSLCFDTPKPASSQLCNSVPCPTYDWTADAWEACSHGCGGGQRKRDVKCYQTNEVPPVEVADAVCVGDGKAKPVTSEECNTQACTFFVGDWSACSTVCGEGVATRDVYCERYVESQNAKVAVADTYCTSPDGATTKPSDSSVCNLGVCPVYAWYEYDWDACSVSCGGGTQTRSRSFCYDINNAKTIAVDDGLCAGLGKIPGMNQECSTHACSYHTGPWSECSAACNGGTQSRTVYCYQTVDGQNVEVNSALCGDASTPPVDTQVCNVFDCVDGTFEWTIDTSWTQCSKTCGGGQQTRTVSCINTNTGQRFDNGLCPSSKKPTTTQECNTEACPVYVWYEAAWGPCDRSCGRGKQERERQTYCYLEGEPGKAVSEGLCDSALKPSAERACNSDSCQYSVGDFGECSVVCGGGVRARKVVCTATVAGVDNTEVEDSYCFATQKPSESEECNTEECLSSSWLVYNWGECDRQCGGGTQERVVTCIFADGAPSPYCGDDKPATTQTCNEQACPVYSWHEGSWGTCSLECGSGERMREVHCIDESLLEGTDTADVSSAQVASHLCMRIKPRTKEACNTQLCPTYVMWTDAFGECSSTCGEGSQTRSVTCYNAAASPWEEVTDEDKCPLAETQVSSRVCNTHNCIDAGEDYVWKAYGWNACSTSCGDGTQKREVRCVLKSSHVPVADELCTKGANAGTKPALSQACNNVVCSNDRFRYRVADWSECDVHCSVPGISTGYRYRKVECVDSEANYSSVAIDTCAGDAPAMLEKCSAALSCPVYWHVTDWSACSENCDEGTKTRTATCRSAGDGDNIVSDDQCLGTRPNEEAPCNMQPCPRYLQVGEWGECVPNSNICGVGTQTRRVKCADLAGTVYEDESSFCGGLPKPAVEQVCTSSPCSHWHPTAWSNCSTTCGAGVQTREVECRSPFESPYDGHLVYSSYGDVVCDEAGEAKPSLSRSCNEDACAKFYWNTGEWSECSSRCGGGEQSRDVTCFSGATQVDASKCLSTQPAATRVCNTQTCPVYEWFHHALDEWSECSGDCGIGGTQTRVLRCRNSAGNDELGLSFEIVDPSNCEEVEPTISSERICNAIQQCGKNMLCLHNQCVCDYSHFDADHDGVCETKLGIDNVRVEAYHPYGVPPSEPVKITWQTQGRIEYVDILLQHTSWVFPRYIQTNVLSGFGDRGTYVWHVDTDLKAEDGYSILVWHTQSSKSSSSTFAIADSCDYLDCGQHGRCHSEDGVCECLAGYTGARCQTKICDVVRCSAQSTCVLGECICHPGFTGTRCDTSTSLSCDACHHDGERFGFSASDCGQCRCTNLWQGSDCSTCGVGVCENGGLANEECDGCKCTRGWFGSTCHCKFYEIKFGVNIDSSFVNDEGARTRFENALRADIAKHIDLPLDRVVVDSVEQDGSDRVAVTVMLRESCPTIAIGLVDNNSNMHGGVDAIDRQNDKNNIRGRAFHLFGADTDSGDDDMEMDEEEKELYEKYGLLLTAMAEQVFQQRSTVAAKLISSSVEGYVPSSDVALDGVDDTVLTPQESSGSDDTAKDLGTYFTLTTAIGVCVALVIIAVIVWLRKMRFKKTLTAMDAMGVTKEEMELSSIHPADVQSNDLNRAVTDAHQAARHSLYLQEKRDSILKKQQRQSSGGSNTLAQKKRHSRRSHNQQYQGQSAFQEQVQRQSQTQQQPSQGQGQFQPSLATIPPQQTLPVPTLPPHWEAHVDPATARTYYWNSVTDASQWDKPTV